jgi:hypothetical protein
LRQRSLGKGCFQRKREEVIQKQKSKNGLLKTSPANHSRLERVTPSKHSLSQITHQSFKNQLGRRNIQPQQADFLRGRIYNRRKKKEHDGGKGKPRSGDQNDPNLRTAEQVAAETGVSPATVKRAREGQGTTLGK